MSPAYYCLSTQIFSNGDYSIVPIRSMDRYLIMQWRNEQIYHLRQKTSLDKDAQDQYFKEIINPLFNAEKPSQILFSFLEKGKCVGYGGLVHINWSCRSAEISFLMQTSRETKDFSRFWSVYLNLIEKVAFLELCFNRIFTYSYEMRPKLYPILEALGYQEETRLKNATSKGDQFVDALVHGKHRDGLKSRWASISDLQLLFDWANDPTSRKNSLTPKPILWENHVKWFQQKLKDSKAKLYIFEIEEPVGLVRLQAEQDYNLISFVVAPIPRGKGLGYRFIEQICLKHPKQELVADVLQSNKASHKIFYANNFKFLKEYNHNSSTVTRYVRIAS